MRGDLLLSQFDAFAKPLKDFRIKTVPGAVVSILSGIAIISLFVSEFLHFLTPVTRQEILVDVSRERKMSIGLDIAFPFIPCDFINVDAMDVSGAHQLDVQHELYKTSIDLNEKPVSKSVRHSINNGDNSTTDKPANYCGPCYGADSPERPCCNTCEEVQRAYQERRWAVGDVSTFEQCRSPDWQNKKDSIGKEGCRLHGRLQVNKVAGTFHIAPGRGFTQNHMHIHDLQAFGSVSFNMTHSIKELSFGDTYPGQINPLDNTRMPIVPHSQMFTYYLKLVPTLYVDTSNKLLRTNQYSVTWHFKPTPLSGGSDGLPGVFFSYEICPLLVKVMEGKRSLLHFLTNTCAIIGGVFTVSGLFDALLYNSWCAIEKRRN